MRNKYVFTVVLLLIIVGVVFALGRLGSGRATSEGSDVASQETMGEAEDQGSENDDVEENDLTEDSHATGELVYDEEELLANEFVIISSIDPIYAAVLNVAGEIPGVRMERIGRNTGHMHHGYHMTPEDMVTLGQADLFVINGGGMEDFLSRAFESFPELPVLDTFVQVSQENPAIGDDPHIWMNPELYRQQVESIRDGLMAADELRAGFYEKNAEIYLEKIDALIAEGEPLKEALAGTPVVVLGTAFAWYADSFGLEILGSVNIEEERPVDAGEVRDILGIINEHGVALVFADDVYGPPVGRILEGEADVRILYLDLLLHGDQSPDHWLNGMENNLSILREAQ